MHVREMVEEVYDTVFFFLTTKMAASRPSLIASQNKMKCICKPSFFILVPSLNKIGKCMSEKWLRTCSTRAFFFQLKWPPVDHLESDVEKKMTCICTPWCAAFVPSTKNLVHTYPSYGCGQTHARMDMKIETKSVTPHFGLSLTGAKNWAGELDNL